MNERIKELAEQAVNETQLLMIMEYKDFESKLFIKFTELIVAECTRIVTNNGVATATHDQMVRQDCVNEIKEHFGVDYITTVEQSKPTRDLMKGLWTV